MAASKREPLDQAKHDLEVAQSRHWEGSLNDVQFAQTALMASAAASLIDIAQSLRLIEQRGGRDG